MRSAHDVAQVRDAESALMARVPEGALMERAAAGLVPAILEATGGAYGLRVVLLVGSGDNGGDALLAGALLARRGARVDAVLLSAARHRHVETLTRSGGRIHQVSSEAASTDADAMLVDELADALWWQRADVVVDGILGIGGSGGLREPAATAVDLIPGHAVVVSVDLPSGVEPDSGEVHGSAVHADLTVCMGTFKPCLLVDPAAVHAGAVQLVDIGLDDFVPAPTVEALQVDDVLALLPWPDRDDDKYRRGAVGILAGSDRYPGAAVLSAAGAIRGGAGYVRCIAARHVLDAVRSTFPEVVGHNAGEPTDIGSAAQVLLAAGRVQSYVVGPGLGTDSVAVALVAAALATDVPVLVDADGLTVLAEHRQLMASLRDRTAPTLLTPHAGELARLLDVERDDVEQRRLHHVRRAAAELGATVLLKGSTTLVAAADGSVAVRSNPTGTAWLGTAGSGDVLSGLAGAYLADGLSALDAGSVAAFVHGVAGQILSEGEVAPLRALELAAALPGAVATLCEHLD